MPYAEMYARGGRGVVPRRAEAQAPKAAAQVKRDGTEINCPACGAMMIGGPKGGLSRNYYCTDRVKCRQGINVARWHQLTLWSDSIGEIDDKRYAMYARGGRP